MIVSTGFCTVDVDESMAPRAWAGTLVSVDGPLRQFRIVVPAVTRFLMARIDARCDHELFDPCPTGRVVEDPVAAGLVRSYMALTSVANPAKLVDRVLAGVSHR